MLAMARATGLARATVGECAYAESFPERAVRRPGRSILDPFIAHLEARMVTGCERALARGAGRGLRARSQDGAEVGGREPHEAGPQGTPDMAARGTGQRSPWHLIRPWPGTALPQAACVAAGVSDRGVDVPGPAAVRWIEQDQGDCPSRLRRASAHRFGPQARRRVGHAPRNACGICAVKTFSARLEQRPGQRPG